MDPRAFWRTVWIVVPLLDVVRQWDLDTRICTHISEAILSYVHNRYHYCVKTSL